MPDVPSNYRVIAPIDGVSFCEKKQMKSDGPGDEAAPRDRLSGSTHRPFVSVILIAYKQESFIREAVQSVLNQTFQPIEIILSDDCSPDETFEIMRSEAANYRGPNKIVLNRNSQNMGLARHISLAMAMSSGQFLVCQAGDDISIPTRVEKLVARWLDQKHPVDLVVSYFEDIDVNSKSTGLVTTNVAFVPDRTRHPMYWHCGATGACAAFSRKLIDKYGPVDAKVNSEDWVYSFRAWLEEGIGVIEEPLLLHRAHNESISVIAATVRENKDPLVRTRLRRRTAASQLGIAEDWLRAAEIRGVDQNDEFITKLRQLVKLREYQFKAFDATRAQAIVLILKFWLNSGRTVESVKQFVRHVLGVR